jgi:predicted ABC-type ATPase
VSSDPPPKLLVIGGPNGSGKSTISATLVVPRGLPIIDPDAIARGIRPDAPELAALAAGREALLRQERCLEQGISFAVEATLAGSGVLRLMDEARKHGYAVHLLFVGIDQVETNVERVAERVARGGHNVPADDVRRRYARSMANLLAAVRRADQVTVIDNSLKGRPREVLVINRSVVTSRVPDLPGWVTVALAQLLAP